MNWRPWTWGWGGWIGLLAFILVLFFLWEPVINFFQAVLSKLEGAR